MLLGTSEMSGGYFGDSGHSFGATLYLDWCGMAKTLPPNLPPPHLPSPPPPPSLQILLEASAGGTKRNFMLKDINRFLILRPIFGIGNRLRAIASAYSICKNKNMKLIINNANLAGKLAYNYFTKGIL